MRLAFLACVKSRCCKYHLHINCTDTFFSSHSWHFCDVTLKIPFTFYNAGRYLFLLCFILQIDYGIYFRTKALLVFFLYFFWSMAVFGSFLSKFPLGTQQNFAI